MNEQEFLNGVRMKINALQCERAELEAIKERQKRHFYKKMKISLLIFSAVIVFIIFAVIFHIDMGLIMVTSIAILVITVWAETMDFEVKKIKIGVRQNGYSYK